MKLLVVKPSSLGDIVHALFAVSLLRSALPQAELWWVANDSLVPLLSLAPGIHPIPFPRKALGSLSLPALRRFLRELRKESFDAVLDFQGLLRSGLVTFFARSPLRYGFAHAREGATLFYNRKVTVPREVRHAVEKNLLLVRAFLRDMGLEKEADAAPPPLGAELPPAWRQEAETLMREHGMEGKPMLAVECASRWPSKSWPVEYFAQVLQEVLRQKPETAIWLLGSPEERPRAQALQELCGLPASSVLAGKTSMGGLCALLQRSRVLFTNDSGPMHIAALEGIPCVANFGSTDPGLTGPYGPAGLHTVVQSPCPQSPCLKRGCPRGDNALCCQGVSPRQVAEWLLQRLSPQGGTPPVSP
ncbi:MAG: glycosyltransferase family 9 protein [Oligosphaeraceae bacterium]